MAAPYTEKGSCRQKLYKGHLVADDLCPPCQGDEDGPGDRLLRKKFTRPQIEGRCHRLHPDLAPAASVPTRLVVPDGPVGAVLDRSKRGKIDLFVAEPANSAKMENRMCVPSSFGSKP